MTPPAGRRLQVAAVGVTLAGYLGLAHYANTRPQMPGWAAGLSLTPEFALALGVVWRSTSPAVTLLLAVAVSVPLLHFWPQIERHSSWMYFVQEAGLDGFLALTFALTLRRGGVPLCTRLAAALHDPLSPAELLYTRRVTLAWAWFFLAMLCVSCVLFMESSQRIWSYFANLCALPLIAAMFVVENRVRRRVLPPGDRPGVLDTLKVYLARPH